MKLAVRKKTYSLAIQKALRKAVDDRQIEDTLDRLRREGRFRTIYR